MFKHFEKGIHPSHPTKITIFTVIDHFPFFRGFFQIPWVYCRQQMLLFDFVSVLIIGFLTCLDITSQTYKASNTHVDFQA
jgi:hypothetical protein